jgi:hypothetical protein
MIVVATMVLYNYIREHGSGDIDFDCVDRDEDYEPTIPERYNKYVMLLDRSTPLSNAPTMDNFRDELAMAIFQRWNLLLCTSILRLNYVCNVLDNVIFQ